MGVTPMIHFIDLVQVSVMPFSKYGCILVRRRWYRCLLFEDEAQPGTYVPRVVGYCNDFDAAMWSWLLQEFLENEGGFGDYWDEVGQVG